MRCQVCNKNPASVHVTELFEGGALVEPTPSLGSPPAETEPPEAEAAEAGPTDAGATGATGKYQVHQKHICEACAQMMNLPHMPVVKKKSMVDIWKLLQKSAQRSRKEGGLTCKHCGMTMAEFRSKGRLGCASCYDSFQRQLDPLLERIHNSVQHTGRLPHIDGATRDKLDVIRDLRKRLEVAIRDEAYEDAATLRDELQALETED